jgi:hypothetical protein
MVALVKGFHADRGTAVFLTQKKWRCLLLETTYGLSDDEALWKTLAEARIIPLDCRGGHPASDASGGNRTALTVRYGDIARSSNRKGAGGNGLEGAGSASTKGSMPSRFAKNRPCDLASESRPSHTSSLDAQWRPR